jgi:tRNA nucleotidyltransferase (CCA-adding enzyme)
MYFLALIDRLTPEEGDEVLKKFVFPNVVAACVSSYKKNAADIDRFLSSRKAIAPGAVYRRLKGIPREAVLYLMVMASSFAARRRIASFIMTYDGVTLFTSGDDLKNAGILPGPRYRDILDEMLSKKIDGVLKTKRDEKKYLMRFI